MFHKIFTRCEIDILVQVAYLQVPIAFRALTEAPAQLVDYFSRMILAFIGCGPRASSPISSTNRAACSAAI